MTVKEKILDALNKFLAKIKNIFVAYNDVVDNCASTSTDLPLSANQGKVIQEKISELNMKLLPKGNFAEAWTTCSRILGSSTVTEIPMRNGDSVLTISSASIFTESGWHDVNASGIYPRINCWLVSLNTENITDIEIGKTYLLKLSGNIS